MEHDLEGVFHALGTTLDASLIRLVIALAQINLHIWHTKDTMQNEPAKFQECMKLAHQLNGIRNQLKNLINIRVGPQEGVQGKTNVETDQLEGWNMTILDRAENPQ